MAIIETTTGSVTTRGAGSMEIGAFYRRNAKASEMVLHEAERDPKSDIRKIGGAEVTPSGAKLSNLKWVQLRNEYPDGSFLRFNVRKTTTGLAFNHRIVNVIIRVRSTGPLNELAVVLPTDQHSSRSKVYIIGRFDVLTPEQVAELGFDRSRLGADESMTYEPVDDESTIFELVVKEQEISKQTKPSVTKVKNSAGKTKLVPKLRVARRVGLRN